MVEADRGTSGTPADRHGTGRPWPTLWRAFGCSTSASVSPGPSPAGCWPTWAPTSSRCMPLHDTYWAGTHMGLGTNRGKRSIALNLKHESGRRGPRAADRTGRRRHHELAAGRRGAPGHRLRDPAARAIPRLVYCNTRGYEKGPRSELPGTDQNAAALTGTEWEDGACDAGNPPLWSRSNMGDTGNALAGGDRHHLRPLPPRPDRRGSGGRHVDRQRRAAAHLLRLDPRRRETRRLGVTSTPDSSASRRTTGCTNARTGCGSSWPPCRDEERGRLSRAVDGLGEWSSRTRSAAALLASALLGKAGRGVVCHA